MISYKEALGLIYDEAKKVKNELEIIDIDCCYGRVLAQDIFSREENPSFSNSAMDGFLIKDSLMKEPEKLIGVKFKVTKTLAAGCAFSDYSDDILQIMTGAYVPCGYSTVVIIEDVEILENKDDYKIIKFKTPPLPHKNIRLKGADIKEGALLLPKDTMINSFHMMSLASQGIKNISVYKKLEVGIISTGDEIVPYDVPSLQKGKIRNSSFVYLRSFFNSSLSNLRSYSMLKDSKEDFKELVLSFFKEGISLAVSTGAVSMGQFDFVKEALLELGAEIIFHKVKIRPGKPILFAKIKYNGENKFFFGMPGNPVSTTVGATFFIKPFINKIFAINSINKYYLKSSDSLKKPAGLTCFYRGKITDENKGLRFEIMNNQLSYVVSQGLEFNAWVILEEKVSEINKDDLLEVISV